ncbi:hypothetical protein BH11VER1_BH11VER1_41290 [soil metagenome]
MVLGGSGCDDATRKLKQSGMEMAEAGKAKIQEVQWEVLFDEFESGGLNIRELAALFASKRWDEAKTWIGKIDSSGTRTVFQTIGEVLYLEEVDGVEGCKAKVEVLLKDKEISLERKKTLEIMQTYVGGKLGRKTSDIAIMIGLTYLSYNGFDYSLEAHGTKIELDKMLFLEAVEYARGLLHKKPAGTSDLDLERLMNSAVKKHKSE